MVSFQKYWNVDKPDDVDDIEFFNAKIATAVRKRLGKQEE